MSSPPARKPLYFVASSWKDLKRLPGAVQDTFGTLLLDVQYGETPASAKRRGIATPKRHLDLVRNRYHLAGRHYTTIEQQEDRHA